jgi:hypothetical protein
MRHALDYEVKRCGGEAHYYEVWLTERPSVQYHGATEQEAVAIMLYEVALLAWHRGFNPEQPGLYQAMGEDPIQHAIDILAGALDTATRERRSLMLIDANPDENTCQSDAAKTDRARERGRLSELIGNLGTAIAALARVKHD